MSPYSRIFATPPITLRLRAKMEPEENDCIVLTSEDIHDRMLRWFPHLHYVTEYLVHKVEDDLYMHVAFQAKQKRVKLVVIEGITDIVSQRVFKDVVSIQGFKGNSLYMWSKVNQLIKADLEPRIHSGHRKVSDLRSILGPTTLPSFLLESGPYRAVRNDCLMRIADLNFHMVDSDGFLVTDFQKHMPFLEKNSVVHREKIIVFVNEDERMCRNISDILICVTSPLFASLYDDFSMMHLALAQDQNDFIYLFVPSSKILAIIDPENLRFSETKLSFQTVGKVHERANAMMNLVSVTEGIVKIGIPTLAFDPSTRFRQIVGYNVWTGIMPTRLKWHCSSQLSTEGNKRNESNSLAKHSSSWNIDVPAFVPSKEPRSLQTHSVYLAKSQTRTDEDTQTEESELESLRVENEQLKNSLNRQKEITEKMSKRNIELTTENRKLATEYEAKIERLKNELRLVKNKERSADTVIFDDELDSSEQSEDPPDWDDVVVTNANIDDELCSMEATAKQFEQIRTRELSEANTDRRPTPIGSERKRRVNIAMRNTTSAIGSPVTLPSTSQCLHSSTLPPLDRSTTPFGTLFSGRNFTAWCEGESQSTGWEELTNDNTHKIDK